MAAFRPGSGFADGAPVRRQPYAYTIVGLIGADPWSPDALVESMAAAIGGVPVDAPGARAAIASAAATVQPVLGSVVIR
jgi:hypothetical protein